MHACEKVIKIYSQLCELTHEGHFILLQLKHNKNYNDEKEDLMRFEIFKNTLKMIEEHNARYEKVKK